MPATTPHTTLHRPNAYAGRCVRCTARIEPGEGLLAKLDGGKWGVDHDGPCPEKPAAIGMPVRRPDRDGMYRDGDRIFKVQVAVHGSGNLYAKELKVDLTDPTHPRGRFIYAPGAVHRLRADQRMTGEQAATYGKLYGFCICCGATLTAEESIERGIGPICAQYAA